MNARKRQGQPLLPTCSPKQPRRTLVDHDGNAPSPSQPNLVERWCSIAADFKNLVKDTVLSMPPIRPTELPTETSDSSDGLTFSPQTHTSQLSQSSSTSVAYENDCRRSSDSGSIRSAVDKAFIRPEEVPLPPSPHKPTFQGASSPPRSQNTSYNFISKNMSSQSTSRRDSGSSTPVIFLESSQNSSPTGRVLKENITPSLRNLNLDGLSTSREDWGSITPSSVASKSATVSTSNTPRRTAQSLRLDPSRRKPRRRDHIYMSVHKAKLKREKQELREKLTNQIFQEKRKQGFSSNLSDLKSFLVFKSQLESIDLENKIGAHHVAGTLSVKSTSSTRTLLDEDDDRDSDAQNQFLRRVLDNIHATVNSPAPPKPFTPTLEQLQTKERLKDDAIEQRLRPSRKALPPNLPPADSQLVDTVLNNRGFTSKYAREQVSYTDITRLMPKQWLNDEIINFYGAMILGRSEAAASSSGKKTLLNIHYFNSFFWTKLTKEGYEKGRLAKWTKKIDIFSKDVILLPVNHNNAHWTAAAINFRNKRFESYDSMGMAAEVVFKALRSYVTLEHHNKMKKPFDFTGWTNWAPETTPQQENGYDCGVFTCQFMEALSRGEESFNFSQQDMPYLRRLMIWEIWKAKLQDDR
ncbi:hypothetical protein D9619_003351 [Psilocybe cf. subviscida]|uniref:Ubiquitin-like protease family profile domain-containing protein n=1 Tax=Psilocybe cf. subviscida TaxID=2480587 RepID=A0A8H5EUG1_9AGAR|nr:hypothetical protein D9619_003351 [Psilocybe cf. subviscida]